MRYRILLSLIFLYILLNKTETYDNLNDKLIFIKLVENINGDLRKLHNFLEIIDKDEVKVSHDNDFVDVLVAIEEEMAAVRELYVGGYMSKGVYISETDRLYEKAKIWKRR